MSGDSITPKKLSTMDSQREDPELWKSNSDVDSVTSKRESDRRLTKRSEDGNDEAKQTDEGAGVDIHNFSDSNEEILSQLVDMPEYHNKLKVINDRITRIVDRMGSLTHILMQVHQRLKNYTNETSLSNALVGIELKKAAGDIGSTQTDPLIKPELNMHAERVGDSVGCQTIEDNPFEC